MSPIYSYIDYRRFLRDYYDEKKRQTRYFSYRYFASRAGINSPNFYKQVAEGCRNLTPVATEKFIRALKLTDKEARFFRALVLFNQAETAEEKQDHYAVLLSMMHTVREQRLTAVALYPDGTPAAGALVRLRPAAYLAGQEDGAAKRRYFARDVRADADGVLLLSSVDIGAYAIEVNDENGCAAIASFTVASIGDSIVLDTLRLHPVGSVGGAVTVAGAARAGVNAGIYGLERLAFADPASGAFSVTDLPAGTFTLRLWSDDASVGAGEITGVSVASDSAATVASRDLPLFDGEDYSQWSDSLVFYVNTSSSGAAVGEGVGRFPLLLRLAPGDVDFSRAHGRGHDVRFASGSAVRLRYEIEQWDSAAGRAAVWVLADTIYGDSAGQRFIMYYGMANAADFSSGRSVFTAEEGYAGVWHLGESGTVDRVNSAGGGFNGRTANYHGDESVPGIIGRCDSLAQTDHDTVGDLDVAALTLSVWVNRADEAGTWRRIVTKAGAYGLFGGTQGNSANLPAAYVTTEKGQRWVFAAAPVPALRWTMITLTYDGNEQRLYVDGAPVGSRFVDSPLAANDSLLFFAHRQDESTNSFHGKLDEVRICRRAMPQTWVRLCYENQREDQRLVTFP